MCPNGAGNNGVGFKQRGKGRGERTEAVGHHVGRTRHSGGTTKQGGLIDNIADDHKRRMKREGGRG
jgi:hypothetical protein